MDFPSNKPKISPLILYNTSLDDEQKLQVALCRRQCWKRGAQLSVFGCVTSYALVVVVEALRCRPFPRGTRWMAPLGSTLFCGYIGSYLGGREGATQMGYILAAHNEKETERLRAYDRNKASAKLAGSDV